MSLYEILYEKILPWFIPVDILGNMSDIFKFFFIVAVSYAIVWFTIILPFKLLKKLTGVKK